MRTNESQQIIESTDKPAPSASTPAASQPVPAQQPSLQVSDAHAVASYTNFCRVTGTPEELIVDFGLNKQPMEVNIEPIAITQRLVMNYFTAKRLLSALHLSVQRHEAVFGVLETDVNKRVLASARRPA